MNDKARVLIAEGRAPLSLRLKDIVEKAGFEAVVAYSGQVALSQTRVMHPDLLLLSDHIGPPGHSEIARRIKEDPVTETIPIIFLATTAEESEALEKSYPVNECLPITTDARRLTSVIRFLAGGGTRRTKNGQPLGPLEGTLSGNSLPEFLEFLFVTKKTGRVSVTDGDRKGTIYLDGGNVVHAEFDEVRGEDAFRKACFLGRGSFKFEPGARASETTMARGGVGLLLEAAKQLDDQRRAKDTDPGRPAPVKPRVNVNRGEPQAPPVMVLAETPAPPRSRAPAPPLELELDLEPIPRTKTELPPAPSATPATQLKPEPLAASTQPGSTTASGRFRPAVTTHSGPHLFTRPGPDRLRILRQWLWPAVIALVAAGALFAAFFLGRFFPLAAPEEVARDASPATALPWEGDRFDVSIESDPAGARVQIDGHDVGLTPVPGLSLKPGSYLLRLQKDGFEPLQREVVVTSEESTHKLNLTLPPVVSTDQATLMLRVVPAGAAVFVDGERLAPSPSPPKFDPGTYRVEVKANGFESWSGQVELAPGATRELAVSLRRLKTASEAESAAKAPEASAPAPEIPVVNPVRISGDLPTYPRAARDRKLKGSVLVEIEVDEQGDVASAKVLESAGYLLDEAVLSAVKNWKYQPATQGGTPVRAFIQTRHTFR